MAQERLRVLLRVKNLAALKGLAVDSACMPFRKRTDGTLEVIAVVSGDTLKKLRRKRTVELEILADDAAETAESSKFISRTNRYADGSLPAALGLRRGHVDKR
jgi:hypothetical protein